AWLKKGDSQAIGDAERRLLTVEEQAVRPERFEQFQRQISALRDEVKKRLAEHPGPIVGYGGGLKAATLVNWLSLTSNELPFVVDGDPHKQGKVIPLANIPIREPGTLTAAP